MDETQLRSLLAGLERRQKVGDRRGAIMDSLAKAQLLTPPLTQALNAATSLAELEDRCGLNGRRVRPPPLTRASRTSRLS
jgi:transcriptional accessory protein Tex/SPT6